MGIHRAPPCFGVVAHYGNEQVGDAGGANIAKRSKLLTFDMVEQQDGAAEYLTLVHRLERACGRRLAPGAPQLPDSVIQGLPRSS